MHLKYCMDFVVHYDLSLFLLRISCVVSLALKVTVVEDLYPYNMILCLVDIRRTE